MGKMQLEQLVIRLRRLTWEGLSGLIARGEGSMFRYKSQRQSHAVEKCRSDTASVAVQRTKFAGSGICSAVTDTDGFRAISFRGIPRIRCSHDPRGAENHEARK
jgi:hypothetical protein